MTRYAYAEVGSALLSFGCTEPGIVEWFLAEAKKTIKAHKLKVRKLDSGELYTVYGDILIGDEWGPLRLWTIRQLCHDGWEPFAVSGSFAGLALRKRLED